MSSVYKCIRGLVFASRMHMNSVYTFRNYIFELIIYQFSVYNGSCIPKFTAGTKTLKFTLRTLGFQH